MSILLFLLFLFNLVLSQNTRPILGILTEPVPESFKSIGLSYIVASYVKYIESAGARVVPIFHNSTSDQIESLFKSINGALFPGGSADIHGTNLHRTAKKLVDLSRSAFDKGDYFPIFGHCLGFELICLIVAEDLNILDPTDSSNVSWALNFYKGYENSRMFNNAPKNIIDMYSDPKNPVTLNNHRWGIYTKHFQSISKLNNFFSIISTNLDKKGNDFVSTIEGLNYPIYGMQWHAEKPQFEWNIKEDINHSFEAIESMQYMSQFFVNEARKSKHKFLSVTEEQKALIYNYKAYFTEQYIKDYEQCYIFPKNNEDLIY